MKSSSAPAAPNPQQTAAAQTQSNEQTAQYQQGLNMVNQVTPLGSLTYSLTNPGNSGTQQITGYDNNGNPIYSTVGNTPPQYTATTQLTPAGQQEFNLQQATGEALDQLALQGTGNVSTAMSSPQSYSGLPSVNAINPSNLPGYNASTFGPAPTANQQDYQNAQSALMQQYKMTLDPQWTQQEQLLKDQLTQQGVTQGSDAWNTAMNNFQTQKTQAYQNAMNNAAIGGSQIEQNQFGMANTAYQNEVANALNSNNVALQNQEALQQSDTSARQQGISEANYLRELPINEVSALLNGGQVSQPTFTNTPQSQVANTNVAGITQANYEDQFQAYQANLQQQNALIGGIFGAAGSALGGWATNW